MLLQSVLKNIKEKIDFHCNKYDFLPGRLIPFKNAKEYPWRLSCSINKDRFSRTSCPFI